MTDRHRLAGFLSRPAVLWIAALLAITARMTTLFWFHSVNNDKSYQLQAALNFLDGHGFTLLQANPADWSVAAYTPLTMWPPGYSLLVSPFLALTGRQPVLASVLLDAVLAILLILVAYRILRLLGTPRYRLTPCLLLTGFFIYPFSAENSSDLAALVLFLGAFLFSLRVFSSEGPGCKYWILMSVLLFMAAFTRYQYIPLALALPACLLTAGRINRNKLLFRKGLFAFLFTGFLIAAFLFLQYRFLGSAIYTPEGENHFRPEKLITLYPFLFASLFNVGFVTQQLSDLMQVSYNSVSWVILVAHHLLLLGLLSTLAAWLWRKRKQPLTLATFYTASGAVCAGLVLLTLAWLGTRTDFRTYGNKTDWTHLVTPRYYAFPLFFFQQWVCRSFNEWKNARPLIRTALLAAALVMTADFAHNAYFAGKLLLKGNINWSDRSTRSGIQAYTSRLIDSISAAEPERKLIILSQPAYIAAQASFNRKVPALYHFESLQVLRPHSSHPVLLLLVVNKVTALPDSLRQMPRFGPAGSWGPYQYYVTRIGPGTVLPANQSPD